jgi:hypothetical protein
LNLTNLKIFVSKKEKNSQKNNNKEISSLMISQKESFNSNHRLEANVDYFTERISNSKLKIKFIPLESLEHVIEILDNGKSIQGSCLLLLFLKINLKEKKNNKINFSYLTTTTTKYLLLFEINLNFVVVVVVVEI